MHTLHAGLLFPPGIVLPQRLWVAAVYTYMVNHLQIRSSPQVYIPGYIFLKRPSKRSCFNRMLFLSWVFWRYILIFPVKQKSPGFLRRM